MTTTSKKKDISTNAGEEGIEKSDSYTDSEENSLPVQDMANSYIDNANIDGGAIHLNSRCIEKEKWRKWIHRLPLMMRRVKRKLQYLQQKRQPHNLLILRG